MSKPTLIINFEDYLMDRFMHEEPCVLDDQMPDAFNDWLCDADPTELIELADKYCKKTVIKAIERCQEIVAETMGGIK